MMLVPRFRQCVNLSVCLFPFLVHVPTGSFWCMSATGTDTVARASGELEGGNASRAGDPGRAARLRGAKIFCDLDVVA
jgi:hypothetical protein